MKTSLLLLLTAGFFSILSCQTLDETRIEGKHRFENYAGSAHKHQADDSPELDAGFDTIVRFSAVDVPSAYDWRRDTACGSADAELIIYENFLPVLKISTGEKFCIGTDPDTHHWINGKLYTEYTTASETVIKRNGEELFRYAGREFLKGLIVDEEGVWTLGQDKEGNGFSLRCNGEPLFRKTEGTVFGNLNIEPHGALYRDCGKLCFCYVIEENGKLYSVIGNNEQSFSPPAKFVRDMFVYNGETWLLCSDSAEGRHFITQGTYELTVSMTGYSLNEAHMYSEAGRINVLGFVRTGQKDVALCWTNPVLFEFGPCETMFLYPEHNCDEYVLTGEAGTKAKGGGKEYAAGPSYLFSRQCFVPLADTYYLAFNPRADGECPRIISNHREELVRVNGFITGIDVQITHF